MSSTQSTHTHTLYEGSLTCAANSASAYASRSVTCPSSANMLNRRLLKCAATNPEGSSLQNRMLGTPLVRNSSATAGKSSKSKTRSSACMNMHVAGGAQYRAGVHNRQPASAAGKPELKVEHQPPFTRVHKWAGGSSGSPVSFLGATAANHACCCLAPALTLFLPCCIQIDGV